MRTWSAKSFGNEQSLDWLADLVEESDPYFIHNTFEIVLECSDVEEPEAWDCNSALAAAEIVAAARGNPPDEFPLGAQKWLIQNPLHLDDELLSLAVKAVRKIETHSELKRLWDANEHRLEWHESIADLKNRLER